jgi:hypothetical protein
MDPADKRRAQRFPMALPVAVKIQELEGQETTVKTKDISSGGVYLEFDSPMEVGSTLEFVLTLPAEITKGPSVRVRCKGKVVRVDRDSSDTASFGVAATIERYEFLRDV